MKLATATALFTLLVSPVAAYADFPLNTGVIGSPAAIAGGCIDKVNQNINYKIQLCNNSSAYGSRKAAQCVAAAERNRNAYLAQCR